MLDKKVLSKKIQEKLEGVSADNTWDAIAEAIVETLKSTVEVDKDFFPHPHTELSSKDHVHVDLVTATLPEVSQEGLVGYWSMDEVPYIPDNPAGTTYRNDAAWTGWIDSRSTLTYTNGIIRASKNNGQPCISLGKGTTYPMGSVITVRARGSTAGVIPCTLAGSSSAGVYKKITSAPDTSWNIFQATTLTAGLGASIYCDGADGIWMEVSDVYVGTGTYSTPLIDNSGSGNHCAIYGAISVEGVSGRALSFTGSSDRVVLKSPMFLAGGTFTASLWYKRVQGLNGYRSLLADSAQNFHPLIVNSEGTNLGVWDGAFRSFGVGPADYTAFHHVVVEYKGTSAKLWYDGSFAAQTFTSLVVNNANIGIVGNWVAYPAGVIDELMIFNRSLSEDEIKSLYHRKKLHKSVTEGPRPLVIKDAISSQNFEITYNSTTGSLNFNYRSS